MLFSQSSFFLIDVSRWFRFPIHRNSDASSLQGSAINITHEHVVISSTCSTSYVQSLHCCLMQVTKNVISSFNSRDRKKKAKRNQYESLPKLFFSSIFFPPSSEIVSFKFPENRGGKRNIQPAHKSRENTSDRCDRLFPDAWPSLVRTDSRVCEPSFRCSESVIIISRLADSLCWLLQVQYE